MVKAGNGPSVAIQALGGGSKEGRERSFDRCYSTFGPAELPTQLKLAVVNGSAEQWGGPLLKDLREVSTVVFFEASRSLELAESTAVRSHDRLLN